MVELRDKVVVNLLLYIAHSKLLVGILAYHSNPCTTGSDIVITDALNGSIRELVDTIVVEYQLIYIEEKRVILRNWLT